MARAAPVRPGEPPRPPPMNRLDEDRAPSHPAAAAPPAPRAGATPGPHAAAHAGVHPMRRRAAHEPVVPAYHPSPGERLRSAFRSHRREIAAVAALIVALSLGIVGTTVGMVRAARQRDEALAARAEADRLRTAAEAGRREAAAVSEFLEAVLGSVNPWGADRAGEISVEQMLDVAAARLDAGSLAAQGEAEARVRATLGHAYAGLSMPRRAEPQFRKSLELRRTLHPRQDHPEVARMMNALAHALVAFGAPRAGEAEALATDSLEMRRRLLGPDHKEVADSLDTLSAVCRVRRDYFTAERRVDEALAMRRRLPQDAAAAKTGLAGSLTNRATLMWRKGDLNQTIDDLTGALEIYRSTLPADHLLLGALHMRLGAALSSKGERAAAINEFRQSVEVRRRHRPESYDDVGEPFRRMAVLMVEQGQYAEAEALLTDRDTRLRALATCPPALLSELYGHFVCLYQAWDKPGKVGPWAERLGESLAREIAAATAAIEAEPEIEQHWADRARLRVRAARFEEAARDFARAIELDEKDHWNWYHLGCLLAYLGEESAYREHCAAMRKRFGPSADGHVLDCLVKTCSLLPGAGGDPATLDRIASGVWSTGGKDQRNASWFRLMKGMSQYRAGAHDAAVNWLTDSLTPDLPHRTAAAELFLAMAQHRLGRSDAARKTLARAEDRVARLTPRPGVGDLAEGGIENWLVCHTALREARAVVGK